MTRSNDDDPQLPNEAEAMLRDWPGPERDAVDWEQSAESILAKVRDTDAPGSDTLLEPPLPLEPGEPEAFDERGLATPSETSGAPAATEGPLPGDRFTAGDAAPLAAPSEASGGPGGTEGPLELEPESDPIAASGPAEERPGLADFARAVVKKETDEIAEMAREGLSLAARTRQGPAPVEPRAGSASAARLQSSVARRAANAASPVTATEAAPEEPISRAPGRAPSKAGGFIALAAALAAAAAFVLYLASERSPGTPSVTIPTAAEPATIAEHAAPEPAPPPQAEPAGAAEADNEEPVLALNDLPTEEEQKSQAAKASKMAAAAPKPSVSLMQRKPLADNTGAGPHEPAAAAAAPEQTEPAPTNDEMRPAAQETAVPDKPSVGAIQGALGSVMTSARSCIAGQEEGAKATITFGSDGRVRTVQIAGPAAGTPAEGCIRGALSGARVSPFAQPEFAVSITVRPP